MYRYCSVQTLCTILVLLASGLGLRTSAYIIKLPMDQWLRSHNLRRGQNHQPSLRSMIDDDAQLFRSLFTESSSSDEDYTAVQEKDIFNEINWRSMKVKLEEEHQRRFKKSLKSKPRKLPYKDARLWVQANLGPDTKEEFMDMVANGNLKTPYIPKQPDVYYGDEWISWDHFLHGIFEVQSTRTVDGDTMEEKEET